MNEAWCKSCGDPFERVEYNPGGNFCSTDCEENWTAYVDARYGGAPVN